jgi:hypothetical protein
MARPPVTVPDAIEAAWAAGVKVRTDGNDLLLEADDPPPSSVLDRLRQQKAAVVAFVARNRAISGSAPSVPPPRPLVMQDGRRLYHVNATRQGSPTEAAWRLVDEARDAHVVTVADNTTLVIVLPAGVPDTIVRRLAAMADDVLAVLHRASDWRLGREPLESPT